MLLSKLNSSWCRGNYGRKKNLERIQKAALKANVRDLHVEYQTLCLQAREEAEGIAFQKLRNPALLWRTIYYQLISSMTGQVRENTCDFKAMHSSGPLLSKLSITRELIFLHLRPLSYQMVISQTLVLRTIY